MDYIEFLRRVEFILKQYTEGAITDEEAFNAIVWELTKGDTE